MFNGEVLPHTLAGWDQLRLRCRTPPFAGTPTGHCGCVKQKPAASQAGHSWRGSGLRLDIARQPQILAALATVVSVPWMNLVPTIAGRRMCPSLER